MGGTRTRQIDCLPQQIKWQTEAHTASSSLVLDHIITHSSISRTTTSATLLAMAPLSTMGAEVAIAMILLHPHAPPYHKPHRTIHTAFTVKGIRKRNK